MIEAKDTIIEGSRFLKIAHEGGLDAAAKAQDEISFKAGEAQGIEKGRREVVDYLHEQNDFDEGEESPPYLVMNKNVWAKQLKEWGVE